MDRCARKHRHKHNKAYKYSLPEQKENIKSSIKVLEDSILRLSKSYGRMVSKAEQLADETELKQKDYTLYEASVPCKVSQNLQQQCVYTTPKSMKISVACENKESTHAKHCICQQCHVRGLLIDSQKHIMEEHGPPPQETFSKTPVRDEDYRNLLGYQSDRESREDKSERRRKRNLFFADIAKRVERLERKEKENSLKYMDREEFKHFMTNLIARSRVSGKSHMCSGEKESLNAREQPHYRYYHQHDQEEPCRDKPHVPHKGFYQGGECACLGYQYSAYKIDCNTLNTLKKEEPQSESSIFTLNSNCLSLLEQSIGTNKLEMVSMNDQYNKMSKESKLKVTFADIQEAKKNVHTIIANSVYEALSVSKKMSVKNSKDLETEQKIHKGSGLVLEIKTPEPHKTNFTNLNAAENKNKIDNKNITASGTRIRNQYRTEGMNGDYSIYTINNVSSLMKSRSCQIPDRNDKISKLSPKRKLKSRIPIRIPMTVDPKKKIMCEKKKIINFPKVQTNFKTSSRNFKDTKPKERSTLHPVMAQKKLRESQQKVKAFLNCNECIKNEFWKTRNNHRKEEIRNWVKRHSNSTVNSADNSETEEESENQEGKNATLYHDA